MKRIIVFVLLMLAASSVFGQFQRVQQIKAGTGVTISPTSGYGVVTITASNAFTGGGATGQVTFWTSATGLSGDTGFTKSGTGATFDLTLGHALIAPIWHPVSDSTTALQINKADGTTNVLNVDTTNGRVGIGTTSPANKLSVSGSADISGNLALNGAAVASTIGLQMGTITSGGAAQLIQTAGTIHITGNAANANGLYSFPSYNVDSGATITNASGVEINGGAMSKSGTGTITNAYGLYINSVPAIGTNNYALVTETGNVILGKTSGNVGIGTTSPTYLLSLGGQSAQTFWMERETTAATAGNALTVQAGGAVSGGTDLAGGALNLASGISTGAGASVINFQTATAGVTGTTDHAPTTKMTIDGVGNVSGPASFSSALYKTATACASSASPAVCSAAPAGFVVIAAGATTVVVNTTAVTANSQIFVVEDESLGTALTVTCNTQALTTLGAPKVTARVAATSFTIGIDVAPTTNPMCISYHLIN